MSPPEALYIAHHLRETLTPDELTATVAHLKAQMATITPLTLEEHAEARIPCGLLKENRCSVYEAQPVACRTWMSPNVADCKVGQLRPWDSTVMQLRGLQDILSATNLGVAAGLQLSGVSAEYLELHSAVLCALETPNAAARWAQGENVFATCRKADRTNTGIAMAFAEIRARRRAS